MPFCLFLLACGGSAPSTVIQRQHGVANSVPALFVNEHDRFNAEMRDGVLHKLRRSVWVNDARGYRMLRPPHLRKLAQFESNQSPVISVYLELTPERRRKDAWHTVFKDGSTYGGAWGPNSRSTSTPAFGSRSGLRRQRSGRSRSTRRSRPYGGCSMRAMCQPRSRLCRSGASWC